MPEYSRQDPSPARPAYDHVDKKSSKSKKIEQSQNKTSIIDRRIKNCIYFTINYFIGRDFDETYVKNLYL